MRRLAAFEVRLEPAGAGVLALLAAAGGLAEAGADAATDADLLRASRPAGFASLLRRVSHGPTSSTRTRCSTFLTAPRNDGVLLTTTTVPGPRKPEALDGRAHGVLLARWCSSSASREAWPSSASASGLRVGAAHSPALACDRRGRRSACRACAATCSRLRSDLSASMVARTTLCGFELPRHLVRMSWMPALSTTARTAPPAMTPVPGEAGLRNTSPAPKWPSVSCGMVTPSSGTVKCSCAPGRCPCGSLRAPRWPCRGRRPRGRLVADDDERAEAEAPAALHDLRDAVDVDDALLELLFVDLELVERHDRLLPIRTSGRPRGRRRRVRARARGRGIRCGRRRPCRCPCEEQPSRSRADLLGRVRLVAFGRRSPRTSRERVDACASGLARRVVDDLRVDVLRAAEHAQPRALGGSADLPADAQLPALSPYDRIAIVLFLSRYRECAQGLRDLRWLLACRPCRPCPPSRGPSRLGSARPCRRTAPADGSRGSSPRSGPSFSLSEPVRMTSVPFESPGISHLMPLREREGDRVREAEGEVQRPALRPRRGNRCRRAGASSCSPRPRPSPCRR